MNLEIHDVIAHDLLPVHCDRQLLEELIPELTFCLRHVPAQFFCERGQLWVTIILHLASSFFFCRHRRQRPLCGRPSSGAARQLPPGEARVVVVTLFRFFVMFLYPSSLPKSKRTPEGAFWLGRFAGIFEHSHWRGCETFRRFLLHPSKPKARLSVWKGGVGGIFQVFAPARIPEIPPHADAVSRR